MKKVYIAGKISSSNPLQFLENIRIGIRASTEMLLKGYAVFSPFLDYNLFLQLRDGEAISKEVIQGNSLEWLKVSDAVLVLPEWESSNGTLREIEKAIELGIPVFYTIETLENYYSITVSQEASR